jgi:protein ImuB
MSSRTGTIWIPDWPLVVALAVNKLPATTPAILIANKRVHVASGYARTAGIRTGMPLRHAQELLPDIEVLHANEPLEAKEFEYIAHEVETLIPYLDILRPGLITFGATGPARYFTSEDALADKIVDLIAEQAQCEAHVGFAEGLLAAILSARAMRPIPAGESQSFLSARPLIDALHALASTSERTRIRELVALWDRLGIRTFGDLAKLPRDLVHTRFGADGLRIHELAHGKDLYTPLDTRNIPEITVHTSLDHPATRVDEAAFYARRLAEQIHNELINASATCGRITIEARMSDGTELSRNWRMDDTALGAMSPERLTQRVRWQLEGWLTNSALREQAAVRKRRAQQAERELLHGPDPSSRNGQIGEGAQARDEPHTEPEQYDDTATERTSALTRLQLTAHDIIGAATHQESLWGASSGGDLRAQRAAERIASLIGPQHVYTIEHAGGRTYTGRTTHRPWEEQETRVPPPEPAPWPGALPSPAPTLLLNPPRHIEIHGPSGHDITFTNRTTMSEPPHTLIWSDTQTQPLHIHDWAGPWPITSGWWRRTPQRSIYLQLIPEHHKPLLVTYTQGTWYCEGIYD